MPEASRRGGWGGEGSLKVVACRLNEEGQKEKEEGAESPPVPPWQDYTEGPFPEILPMASTQHTKRPEED